MARKTNVRTVLNRKALSAFAAGIADGMEELGQAYVEVVTPNIPDAPPYGKGLPQTADFGVWSNGKKVAGGATKPRTVRVKQHGAILVAGEGFPGRFQELGTVKMAANPHVTPAMLTVLPDAEGYIKPAVRKRLARA
jgi:hypothetical protein